jgi:hypothetical protein
MLTERLEKLDGLTTRIAWNRLVGPDRELV